MSVSWGTKSGRYRTAIRFFAFKFARKKEPMSVYRYVHLDVFSNQPFTGIQLAMFPDAAGIDERRMQRIANEMALPETTFVFLLRLPRPTRGFAHSNPRDK
jgi:hypothetical protein